MKLSFIILKNAISICVTTKPLIKEDIFIGFVHCSESTDMNASSGIKVYNTSSSGVDYCLNREVHMLIILPKYGNKRQQIVAGMSFVFDVEFS